jgi:UDP-glucose 4-epimerase
MDISSEEEYQKLAPFSFDAVLHLAAQSSGEISNEAPVQDLKVNTLGTVLLLNMCRQNNIPRFMYASSMAVYGNVSCNPVPESVPCHPLSFYGITKCTSEHYVNHFSEEGLNTTCFRMFSVYGPGQNLENMKQGMVSIFLAYLMNNEEIWVKGSGDRFRDFIYIDDVVDAWMLALDSPSTYGKTYNLATGVKTTVRDLVESEIREFGYNVTTYPVKFSGSTPFDQHGLYADITQFSSDTGWKPKTPLADGLGRMVKWVKSIKG